MLFSTTCEQTLVTDKNFLKDIFNPHMKKEQDDKLWSIYKVSYHGYFR